MNNTEIRYVIPLCRHLIMNLIYIHEFPLIEMHSKENVDNIQEHSFKIHF